MSAEFFDSKKPIARLENWHIGDYDLIYGQVFGHPKLPDGSWIATSRVVRWDVQNKRAITVNTNYVLGRSKEEGLGLAKYQQIAELT